MYIQNFLPEKSVVLDRAFANPKLKKGCDVAAVVRVVHDTVEAMAKDALRDEIMVDLSDAAAQYEVINGRYEDVASDREREDYESGIDDVIESALEPYVDYLSADWLGRNTIGTLAWKEEELRALSVSAGKEVWKQLTFERTPAQILANAGIVQADIEARLAEPPIPANQQTGDETVSEQLEAALARIRAHIGKDFDHLSVYEDIETIVTEDDTLLVNSAASRLGASQAEIDVMQIAAFEMDDPATEIFEKVKAASAKPAPKARKAAEKSAKAEGIDASIMEALKTCGAGDTAMAEALGVSRSTYLKYVTGKSALAPSADQHDTIRGELVTRANMLLAALAALDGVEPHEVS